MTRTRHSHYEYSVYEYWPDCHRYKNLGYCYSIYKPDREGEYRECDQWYETREAAENAAIRHIELLEMGVG